MHQHPLPGCTILKCLSGLQCFAREASQHAAERAKLVYVDITNHLRSTQHSDFSPNFKVPSHIAGNRYAILNNNMQDKHNTHFTVDVQGRLHKPK